MFQRGLMLLYGIMNVPKCNKGRLGIQEIPSDLRIFIDTFVAIIPRLKVAFGGRHTMTRTDHFCTFQLQAT